MGQKTARSRELVALSARVAQWRKESGGGRGSRIPEALWEEAVRVASIAGLYPTARALRFPLLLAPSAKGALDRDWSQPGATQEALEQLTQQLEALVTWLSFHHGALMGLPPVSLPNQVFAGGELAC